MSSTFKNRILYLLTLVLLLAMVAGCTSSPTTATPAGTTTAGSPAASSGSAATTAGAATTTVGATATTADVAEVQTLKVWQSDNWGWDKPGKLQDWDSYPNCVEITKKTGIKLEYIVPVGTQDELLGPMIASNTLPDSLVITHYTVNPYINQMIEAGMLWSFDDLLGQYAPQALAKLKESSAYSFHKYTDNKLYKFVGFEANAEKAAAFNAYGIPPTDGGSMFWARSDILKAFGKDDITSLDDYTDYLRYVKKNYPDLQPLQLMGTSYYPTLMATFGVPYIGASGSMRGNITADGKIEVYVKNEHWIEYAKWFNMLFREGVISASQFTEQGQQADERQKAGKVGSFMVHYYYVQDNINKPLVAAGMEDQVYVDIGPIQKEGIPFELPMLRDTGVLAFVVSKNIKDPAVAAKWFDMIMYNDEINRLATGGFEGTDYTINSDGSIKVSEDFAKGINENIEQFVTRTGFTAKFLPWISGPNWVSFIENPMAGKDVNPAAYDASIRRQGEKFIVDMWAKGFVDLPTSIDPTTPAGVAKTKCDESMQDLFLKLVVAKSDAEFQSIYDAGITELGKLGVDQYEQALNDGFQKRKTMTTN